MPNSWKSPQTAGLEAYLVDLQALPVLDDRELEMLYPRAFAGDRAAIDRIVLAHLPLVVRIAYGYSGYGLPLIDLISEGNIGLLRAAELFDPQYGVSFATYAGVWVKQRMHRAITAQAQAVRIPIWRSQRLRKLDRLHAELTSELGREAEIGDVAKCIGLAEEQVAALAFERIRMDSLDATGAGHWLAEQPEEAFLPSERLSKMELLEEIAACLDGLDDTELKIVSLKFGLQDQQPASYREMAPLFGKSREWVRKIGEGALAKIKGSFAAMGELPRFLIKKRRKSVRVRLKRLSKKTESHSRLSLLNMALMNWVEPLLLSL